MATQLLAARYVVPGDRPPIKQGRVLIHGARIAAVGAADEIDGAVTTDFGDAVLLPGLVNAHTHLELSDLAGKVPPGPDFADWLGRLMTQVRSEPPTHVSVAEAVCRGVMQSTTAGVTAIGDIARNHSWVRAALAQASLRGVSYGEVIAVGARRDGLDELLASAADAHAAGPCLRIGVSPHAPYTVEPDGLRRCGQVAVGQDLPVCIHAAETEEEAVFTMTGGGPLADHLRRVGVWDEHIPVTGLRPIQLLHGCGLLAPRTLLAHANYADDDDIRLLSSSGASVVYCPRTHHAFGHRPHRFCEMLRAGVNVCVGTDSLASNPDLSVLSELRFLYARGFGLSPEQTLAMGTIRGAKALGLDEQLGSITVGKCADLVVIPLSGASWESILESDDGPMSVLVGGVACVGM